MYSSRRSYSITWRGREVQNPMARKLVATLLIVLGAIMVPLTFVFLMIMIPLSLPWHFLLRLFGHPGFSKWEGTKLSYNVPWWGALLSLLPVALIILL